MEVRTCLTAAWCPVQPHIISQHWPPTGGHLGYSQWFCSSTIYPFFLSTNIY